MNQALVVLIITTIMMMIMAEHMNSFTAAIQVTLAKQGSIKSGNNSNPTRSECLGAVRSTGIALQFIAACILLYPHDFKKSEGGTLERSDSSVGVDPLTHKR